MSIKELDAQEIFSRRIRLTQTNLKEIKELDAQDIFSRRIRLTRTNLKEIRSDLEN